MSENLRFRIDGTNNYYTNSFYNKVISPLTLSLQAPQNFVSESNSYKQYSVVLGNGVFVYDKNNELIYSRIIDNIEDYQLGSGLTTYLITTKTYNNGQYNSSKFTTPNKNVLYDYDTLKSYEESGFYIWRDLTIDIQTSQVITIKYKIGGGTYETLLFSASLAVVNNVLPLKRWTITDVINRCFDTVEPLEDNADFKNRKPRFRLQGVVYKDNGDIDYYEQGSQAEKYDKIIAPEFAFTQNTLREMLSQVGGFIHAEPRITRKVENGDDEYWEVAFDEYGSNEISHISNKRYVSAGYKTNINDYCTSLDSSAQNLINVLDYAQGVTFEPFYTSETSAKGISIRTENTTMRIAEDDSSFIPTTFRNYLFKGNNQVRITYIPGVSGGPWDITPYIFEKADYDGKLDSFDGVYPYSKSYALYYTQGEKNIYGLFFKPPNVVSESLEHYSIVKIIQAVTGNGDYKPTYTELLQIRFSISYLPITNARVRTAKQKVLGGLPSTIAYNQGANNIETRYYGENLKGVVARLGNIEKTYTYHLAFLSEVPKVGMLFDENYYISTVSTEVLPQYIRCTIGLSKDFNRLSEYVGISSNKRMWEVSEKMSQERQSVYTEYLVIKRNADSVYNENQHWQSGFVHYFSLATKPINLVELVTKDKKGEPIANLCLPVISMALGNSMLFTFAFQDNYSAGQRIENDGYANYVSYADVYGRAYYLDMTFVAQEPVFVEEDTDSVVAQNFPRVDLDNSEPVPGNIKNFYKPISITNYRYRKDSRECPQITYELCAVSEDGSLIIGSALMRNISLVNRNPIITRNVYGFDKLLNKFENEVDLANATLIGTFQRTPRSIKLPKNETGQTFKSWAIVTPPQEIKEQVEDEDGNTFEQVISRGSELILGANGDYVSEENILFEIKGIRDIYDI